MVSGVMAVGSFRGIRYVSVSIIEALTAAGALRLYGRPASDGSVSAVVPAGPRGAALVRWGRVPRDRRPRQRPLRARRRVPDQPPLPAARRRGGAARRAARSRDAVVFSGWRPAAAPSEAEQMRDAWRGPDVELVVEPTASLTAQNAARTLPLLLERGIERAVVVCAPLHSSARGSSSAGVYGRFGIETEFDVVRMAPTPAASRGSWRRCRSAARQLRAAEAETRRLAVAAMSDTVVFIPAWNEELNLPGGARRPAPAPARRRTCSSSTTARPTAPPRSPASTAPRCSRSASTAACAPASRPATSGRSTTSTRSAAASTPTASTRPPSSRGCSRWCARTAATWRSARASSPGDGYAAYRYKPSGPRRFGTAVLRRGDGARAAPPVRRRDERPVRRQREGAPAAREAVHEPAPEVEALIRITDAGLRLEEVPVNMADRAERRVEAARQQGDQARADRRRDAASRRR